MTINRYNYLYNNPFINNNQPSILGPNSDNNLLPEDVSAYIQQLLANINVDRKDNTYRVTPPKETIKPLHEPIQFNNGIKETEDNLTNTLNSINYDTIRDTVDRTRNLFKPITDTQQPNNITNKITAPVVSNTTNNLVTPTNTTRGLGDFTGDITKSINSAYNKEFLATINAANAANINYSAPTTDLSYLNDFTTVTQNPNGGEAISQVTNSGGSGFNWQAGAGMAAGLAKAAYNKWAPNIYTIGVDDGLEKAAYESIYGDSHQDPLARAATSIFQTNDQRMSNVLGQVNSRPLDYSGVRNNDNLINTYQDLSDLKTLDYDNPFTWENAGLFAAGVPFLSRNKQIQDFNQSTGQGALAGLSYSGGNPWMALAGAALGSITGVANLIGSKKRTQMYNDAVEKAKRENIESFYNTARRNQDEEIFNSMRMMAEGGSLEELNGVTKIDAGSTHEQNPYNGVQMGIASDNLPNLVEEGEIVYKDYVYSNRLKPSKSLLKQYNLPEKYAGKTFAEIGDKLQKESEERPNDPISLQTLNDWMSRLQNAQEEYKAKAEERRLAKVVDNMSDEEKAILLSSLEQPMAQQEGIDLSQPMYAKGGKIHIKPENRGKFTALRKRTGKSASWFKAHGTPAQKKMATFALNAKKWSHKHEDGGHLFPWGGNPYLWSLPKTQQDLELALLNDRIQRADLGVSVGDYHAALQDGFNAPILTKDSKTPLKVKVSNDKPTNNKKGNTVNSNGFNGTMLRYAPAVGAGLGALYAWTQPKDYEYPNELRELATEFKPISAPHVGGRLSYTPYDINLGDAENLALLTATLRANRSNANRGQQTAGAIGLINTFEKQNALRNLEWQQANEANRKAIAQYNLGIDQFNAQRDSQYDQLNQQILNNRLNMLGNAAQAADASRTAWAANINSTTENAFNQLGNVGRDEWNRNQRDFLLKALGREGLLELIKSGYFKS